MNVRTITLLTDRDVVGRNSMIAKHVAPNELKNLA